MIAPVITVKFYTATTTTISLMSAMLAAHSIEAVPSALSSFFLAWN
jgi:hypothetical protein